MRKVFVRKIEQNGDGVTITADNQNHDLLILHVTTAGAKNFWIGKDIDINVLS